MSHGAVFVHFPSRDDLIAAVADAIARDFKQALAHSASAHHAELADGLQHHVNVVTEHAAEYRSLMLEAFHGGGAVRQVWTALQHEVVRYLHELMSSAQDRAELNVTDLDAAVQTWIALVHHALARSTPAEHGRRRWPDDARDLSEWFVSLAS